MIARFVPLEEEGEFPGSGQVLEGWSWEKGCKIFAILIVGRVIRLPGSPEFRIESGSIGPVPF